MRCRESVNKAQARLIWEVLGLLFMGAILGAGIVTWRRLEEIKVVRREMEGKAAS